MLPSWHTPKSRPLSPYQPQRRALDNSGWQKSSYSGSSGGGCVEVARNGTQVVVRDSKDADGPKLHLDHSAFAALIIRTKK
ncbi:DUF397 domain-containing protein [Actinomadura sp. SCN-SB]|uniref:DUF397 domain-containing protein n=1 Tax=Actinomadura sp. SCN-SB TaxID=3373092 RepID=UPI003751F09B